LRLAKAVSQCLQVRKGGELGTFGRNMMVKEFVVAAFALEKGKLRPNQNPVRVHINNGLE
jgi:parvulin-like peptidyl-prolyl isomerase